MTSIGSKKWTCVLTLALAAVIAGSLATIGNVDIVHPRLFLSFDGIGDTDDMCIWIHPTDTSQSTIIAADKASNALVVYDLSGVVIQMLRLPKTVAGAKHVGNVDIRYGFPLGSELVDIVAFNNRDPSQGNGFRIYKVDPDTRVLTKVDDGASLEHPNYGMCLYKSHMTGKFYAFATSKSQGVVQYELVDNARGQIAPVFVRRWNQKKCEGAVADDELGYVYICEEDTGIWRYAAEPDASTEGTLIAEIGEDGFVADAEGITIYYARNGGGYIIVSSQGNSTFLVFKRVSPHAFVKSFYIEEVKGTDGVDVTNVDLGSAFPHGLFVCHANGDPSIAVVSSYHDLGLEIDISYDPRTGEYRLK